MSKEKLSSEQVPHKFSEWLLAMGCPPESVPPLDKITEMCRGQYYMVWRSMMERIGPKDSIINKRLQVFNDDVIKCQKRNELDVNMPKELHLWVQHSELKQRVADAEARVQKKRDDLNQLMSKVSSNLAQCNLSKKRLQDAQRRSWLLQQVSAELHERKRELQETKNIAESLCCHDESQDVESKLDKCVSALTGTTPAPSRVGLSLHSAANPVASSSSASTGASEDNDTEEHMASLMKCRGDIVFKQLLERRAALCSMAATTSNNEAKQKNKKTVESVLAHTAALHCTLALEAVKNRAHIKQTNRQLLATLSELNLSDDACELMVVRCELATTAARVNALRSLCDELRAGEGVFAVVPAPARDIADRNTSPASIHELDKNILSKKEELKRLIESYGAVERKTQNIRENLVALFNTFHLDENERFEGGSLITTQGSISTLRQFYKEWRGKRQKKMELSMNLDISENSSYNELTDNANPKFIDELRFYLKKFNLEKNRKLVMESGEKIWIFESVQSSLDQLYAKWWEDDVTTSVICPSVSVAHNLDRLAQTVMAKTELEAIVRFMVDVGKRYKLCLDISSTTEEERKTLDKVKKRLNANILTLKNTAYTLDIGVHHLTLWKNNTITDYISENRTVDGKSFKDYERAYKQFLNM